MNDAVPGRSAWPRQWEFQSGMLDHWRMHKRIGQAGQQFWSVRLFAGYKRVFLHDLAKAIAFRRCPVRDQSLVHKTVGLQERLA